MKYLLMLTDVDGAWDKLGPEKQEAVMKSHGEAQAALKAKNKYHTCGRLGAASAAKTVRLRPDGSRVVSNGPGLFIDGPHAETKEFMGGYYMIEADSIDEAVEWAKKIPMAYCSMEIREVWED